MSVPTMIRFDSRRRRRVVVAVVAMLGLIAPMMPVLQANAVSAAGAPTIASDKADYSAGSTVTLSGTDWQPNEAVHIVVNDTVGQTWTHDVNVAAGDDGTVSDVFSLPAYSVSD